MARLRDLERFAATHGLKICTVADLIQYRLRCDSLVHRVAEATHRQPLRRRVPHLRLSHRRRRRRARGAGEGRHRSRRAGAGARPRRVSPRRRLLHGRARHRARCCRRRCGPSPPPGAVSSSTCGAKAAAPRSSKRRTRRRGPAATAAPSTDPGDAATRLPRVRHRRADPARRRRAQDPPAQQLSAPPGQPAGLRPRDRRVRPVAAGRRGIAPAPSGTPAAADARARPLRSDRSRLDPPFQRGEAKSRSPLYGPTMRCPRSANTLPGVEGVDEAAADADVLAGGDQAGADAADRVCPAPRVICSPQRIASRSLPKREPVAPVNSASRRSIVAPDVTRAERLRHHRHVVVEQVVLAARR